MISHRLIQNCRNQRVWCAIAVCACLSGHAGLAAAAQGRGERGRGEQALSAPADGVSPAEVQRLFDAYVVMQAQQELQLTDEQWGRFLGRVRVLQEARRKGQVERARRLQQLRRLSQVDPADDTQLRTELKALSDLDERTSTEIKQAEDGIDQVLTPRQQARFRLFEEQMERRKVELLLRARQANRSRNQF